MRVQSGEAAVAGRLWFDWEEIRVNCETTAWERLPLVDGSGVGKKAGKPNYEK